MKLIAKPFCDLTSAEVYEIIKSRAEIFLFEQNIMCMDLDDIDYRSLHCFFTDGKRVTAYLRAFRSDDDAEAVTVGRVLTLTHGKGLGRELMEKSTAAIKQHFGCRRITLHAQKKAAGFYDKLGFNAVSDEFYEAGIPHVMMELEII